MNALPRAVDAFSSSMLLQRLKDAGPNLRAIAERDDRHEAFPDEAMHLLAAIGVGNAVLPKSEGGLGLGWERDVTAVLLEILRLLGAAHLPIARLYEGHVNAFMLLWRYGQADQRAAVCRYVRGGGWLGVWNAPHPSGACRLVAEPGAHTFRLRGSKAYCSGAGGIARPLLTANDDTGTLRMLWPDVRDARIDTQSWGSQGMRASVTYTVDFDDVLVVPGDIFGGDDVYHREPAFSAGAWRFLAAQLGAGEEMFDLMRADLLRNHRAGDPHQRARLAQAGIALRSAAAWTESAAWRAEGSNASEAAIRTTLAHVAMARTAIEQHLQDVMRLCLRCVGLRAQLHGNPLERIARDLRTYLQQPVPDLIVDRVAQALLDDQRPIRESYA